MKKSMLIAVLILLSTAADAAVFRTDSLSVVRADAARSPSEEYVPPSPKAMSFLKYGDYPVSYYTGLVDITIPVYTIKTSWMEVPVTFRYHSSGLRYDDISMEAGLGWDMIAGGVVTHTVRGVNDSENAQKFAKDALSVQVITDHENIGEDYDYVRYVHNGALPDAYRNHSLEIRDGEADWWQFSFPGHSGNFFYDIQSCGWIMIPKDGLVTPQYGGNISKWTWRHGEDEPSESYLFRYDGHSRLVEASCASASSGSGLAGSAVTYDLNGNILSLTRKEAGHPETMLQYQYDGNRMISCGGAVYFRAPVHRLRSQILRSGHRPLAVHGSSLREILQHIPVRLLRRQSDKLCRSGWEENIYIS